MKKNYPLLQHASLREKSIQQALGDKKLILFITSTPSYSKVLKQEFPTKNIQNITGANHNEYDGVIKALKDHEVDILIVGIEQLINPSKLDVILQIITPELSHVMIDHVHQISLFNHDTKAEYFTLKSLYDLIPDVEWLLFSYALSDYDKQVLTETFTQVVDTTIPSTFPFTYYPTNKALQLQVLYNYAIHGNILVVSHDYFQAEITAHKLNQLFPSAVLHRKVEETNKIAFTKKWQEGTITSLITTSDTLLPYPYPKIDTILWIQVPLNMSQMQEWHDRFGANQSIVVGAISDDSYTMAITHNFPYDETLTCIMDTIKSNPLGITMREMEQYINIESYTFEKALQGLKALQATKKVNSKYVLNQPWQLNQAYSSSIQDVKHQLHQDLCDNLLAHQQTHVVVSLDNVQHIYDHVSFPLRPKVLFPIGFYPKSLIHKSWMSNTGYVFEEAYKDIDSRSTDILVLIQDQDIPFDDVCIIPLSKINDSTFALAKHLAKKLNIPLNAMFSEFDSSLLSSNKNPFHKMKFITDQLDLMDKSPLKTTTIVVADHADHYWQMAVVAYELLSNNITKKVIVIFNQP